MCRVQHSMLYFFHHYELPRILRQVQLQNILMRTSHARPQATASPPTPPPPSESPPAPQTPPSDGSAGPPTPAAVVETVAEPPPPPESPSPASIVDSRASSAAASSAAASSATAYSAVASSCSDSTGEADCDASTSSPVGDLPETDTVATADEQQIKEPTNGEADPEEAAAREIISQAN